MYDSGIPKSTVKGSFRSESGGFTAVFNDDKMVITCPGDITITCDGDVTVEAKNIEINATKVKINCDVEVNGNTKVSGVAQAAAHT